MKLHINLSRLIYYVCQHIICFMIYLLIHSLYFLPWSLIHKYLYILLRSLLSGYQFSYISRRRGKDEDWVSSPWACSMPLCLYQSPHSNCGPPVTWIHQTASTTPASMMSASFLPAPRLRDFSHCLFLSRFLNPITAVFRSSNFSVKTLYEYAISSSNLGWICWLERFLAVFRKNISLAVTERLPRTAIGSLSRCIPESRRHLFENPIWTEESQVKQSMGLSWATLCTKQIIQEEEWSGKLPNHNQSINIKLNIMYPRNQSWIMTNLGGRQDMTFILFKNKDRNLSRYRKCVYREHNRHRRESGLKEYVGHYC